MTSIDKDVIARNRIVSEINQNFFVEAGAGSGKTTMLVNRMVAMVEAGIDISKICAITFTKAAAGEFYERFQKLLIERSKSDYQWEDQGVAGQLPEPTEVTRQNCAKALENIDLCFMGTIDSFCAMILSEHPSEAKILSDSSIVSDEEAKSLYHQIYVKICAGEYGKRLQELAKEFRKFHWNAEEVFAKGIEVLMDRRNAQFQYDPVTNTDIDQVFQKDRENIIKALECLLAHPELMYSDYKKSIEVWEKLPDITAQLKRNWSNNLSGIIYNLKELEELRAIPTAIDKFPVALSECFRPGGAKGKWLEFIPSQSDGVLNTLESLRYSVSMTFCVESLPVIEQVMRENGIMRFFDCLYYLREMLREDAIKGGKLIRYIYDRHSYFLIDEFQDTNPMQAEIFFYLSSEYPVEQWNQCVPRPGSLFIVGDPKQSIYRFRGADVTAFLNVKRTFQACGGEVVYLSRNFRSTKPLIECFNNVFQNMFSEETEIQSKFEEIPVPTTQDDVFQGIYKYEVYAKEEIEDHPGESDAQNIKNIIQKLVGRSEYQIHDENGKPRPIHYGDIMVITRGKESIVPIMQALDQENIPMHVEGQVAFGRNDALLQVLGIYKAISDTKDQNALFEALKSNLIGLSESEMMRYRLAGGAISLSTTKKISDDADEIAKKVDTQIEKLKQLANKACKLSPAALLSEILEVFEVYKVALVENMEVLYYSLELLRNAERTGIVVSLKDGAKFIESLVKEESGEERCLSLGGDKECVHIANLHKVKGLEAPIVILAAEIKSTKSPSIRMLYENDSTKCYVFALTKGKKGNYFSTKAYEEERIDEKNAMDAENQRLIYVAATRAKNALIMCEKILKSKRKTVWEPLTSEKEAKDIFEILTNEPQSPVVSEKIVTADDLYQKAEQESVLNSRDSEEDTYAIQNPSLVRSVSKIKKDEDKVENYEDEMDEVSIVHKFPAHLGTLVHRLMELVVLTKNTLDYDRTIAEILQEYDATKYQKYEKDFVNALKNVVKTINSGGYEQKNQAPQDILNTLLDADEVYCEVPFCYQEEIEGKTVIWNGIMDVIYCKDGKWHIIDYKTNVDGEHLDVKYQAQLEAYKKAFKSITGNNADAYVYHIDV